MKNNVQVTRKVQEIFLIPSEQFSREQSHLIYSISDIHFMQ